MKRLRSAIIGMVFTAMLVGGFPHPSYEIAYNPPYYRELFESYGFRTYYKQEGFHLDVKKSLPARFQKIAGWIAIKPEYEFRYFEWKKTLKKARVMASKPHYTEIEFSWVGDFNPRMRKIFISVGSIPVKHYITYRYLFDRNAAFKRYPIPVDN